MELFVSEIGNSKDISIKKATKEKRESVYYNGEEFLITASYAAFLNNDKKELVSNYEEFKRIFGELKDVHERKDYDALNKFIIMILNNRNFHFTISSKPYLLAKLVYISLHGRNNYASNGNATLYISDIARLKDEFVYPLLTACKSPTYDNFKKLLTALRDCPCYYLSDNRNTFKDDIRKLLWRKDFSVYEKQIYDLDLDDNKSMNQLFTLISLASLTSKWNINTEVEQFKINQLTVSHSSSYTYDQDKLIKMGVPFFNIEYKNKMKSEILCIIEDINYVFHYEFSKMIEIFRNNGDYDNVHFKFVSLFLRTVTQLNCEFQIPTNEWALLMGVMDLINSNVADFYHQSHVVDYLIVAHYTRVCEYLKNHGDELHASKVFKTRV